MRKTIITLVVALATLVPASLLADGMPPSGEKAPAAGTTGSAPAASKVTMSDLQPDAPNQYTVVKGDTLWGISGRFLKDPWKWPQVWEMNRDQIKDPHWIYPGNVIRLDRGGAGGPQLSLVGGGSSGGTEAEATANVVKLEPRIHIEPLQAAIPSIPSSAIGPFLSQPLVVDAGTLGNAPVIVATEESRVILGSGDTAYADRIGTDSGVNWQVFRPGVPLRDPESGELLGYEAKYIGDARVRRYGNPTTLVITKAREEVNRGDKLMAARETSVLSYVPHAPDKPIRGVIMSVDGGVSEIGQFQVVTINRGSRDGIEVGNVLAVYRQGQPLTATARSSGGYFDSATSWFRGLSMRPVPVVPDAPGSTYSETNRAGAVLEGRAITLPEERNGLLFVFRVFEKMSYAMVMKATRPIYLGDVVHTP